MRYWNMARQRYCCGLARCWRALRLSADRAENAARKRALFGALIEESGSHMTCMGLFLSSGCYWVLLTVLCSERERPFFIPSPAIQFPERAEGVKGPKR
jgi:hypothetical protein